MILNLEDLAWRHRGTRQLAEGVLRAPKDSGQRAMQDIRNAFAAELISLSEMA